MAAFDDLRLALTPPRLLRVLGVGVHLVAVAALLTVTPSWLVVLSLPVVALSALLDWRSAARMPQQLQCVGGAGGRWTAQFSDASCTATSSAATTYTATTYTATTYTATSYTATLFDAPCVSRWFTVLRLVEETDASGHAVARPRRQTIILGGDQLSDMQARRLIRVLRTARR